MKLRIWLLKGLFQLHVSVHYYIYAYRAPFRNTLVFLQICNDIISIPPPWGSYVLDALGFWKRYPNVIFMFHVHVLSTLNGLKVNRLLDLR